MIKGKVTWSGYCNFIKLIPIGALIAVVARVMVFNSLAAPNIEYIPLEAFRIIVFCFITFFIDFFVYCYLLSKFREEPSDKLSAQLLRENLKPIMWLRIKSLIIFIIIYAVTLAVLLLDIKEMLAMVIYAIKDVVFLAEILLAPLIVKSFLGESFTDKENNRPLHLQD